MLTVIIECRDQEPELAQTLAALGCTYGQGYLYARPLEADAAYALMMAGR